MILSYLTVMGLLWGIVALLGGTVAAYGLMAYRRNPAGPMLALAVGLLLLSVGPAIMWIGLYSAGDNLYDASEACVGLMVGGFACLFYAARGQFR